MTEPTEQLRNGLEGITLSPAEHASMRSVLAAFVAATPPRASAWAFAVRHAAAFSMGAFVLLAGATTTLAQQSLPGGFFYPIRLAVNDRFSVALAGDVEARTDREFDQIERILDEEEFIASEELASLAVEIDSDVRVEGADDQSRQDGDVEVDVVLDAEIRSLEQLLDQEESAAELELSL